MEVQRLHNRLYSELQRRKPLCLVLRQRRKPQCSVLRQLRLPCLVRQRKRTKRLYSVLVSSLFLAQRQHRRLFLALLHRLTKHLFLGLLLKLHKRRCLGRRRQLRRPYSDRLLRPHKLLCSEAPHRRLSLELLLPQQAARYLAVENLYSLRSTFLPRAHLHKAAKAYSEEGETIS